MFTRIDNILIEMRLKVGKLFDMYKIYAEKIRMKSKTQSKYGMKF
jgi:hypothetical protein